MTALHQATQLTKKTLMIIGIIIGSIMFLFIAVRVERALYNYYFPPKKPPPTVAFGKLPEIQFPQNAVDLSNATYYLNTVSGGLPTFPDRQTVYTLEQPQPNLLALANIKNLVEKLAEFSPDPTPLSDVSYQWKSSTPPFKKLTFNILTHDFNLTSSYTLDPNVINAASLGNDSDAITQSKEYLNLLASFPDDIDETKTKTSFFAITNGALVLATSLSNAQIIRVDFFQNDVNKLPIYYPTPAHSLIHVLVASGEHQQQIVNAVFIHRKVMTDTSATYPLKTAKEAFDALQEGKAYIASYKGAGKNIAIHDISLGYYLSDTTNQYIMPIIVFQGDDEFMAFVSAIKDEWIYK